MTCLARSKVFGSLHFLRLGGKTTSTGLLVQPWSFRLGGASVLGLELCQVLHVLLVLVGLLIHGQLDVVSLFSRVCLRFEGLFAIRIQLLPPLSNKLGNLGEGEVQVFHFFTNFVGEDHVC
jgi:hypothetical protein